MEKKMYWPKTIKVRKCIGYKDNSIQLNNYNFTGRLY